MNVHPWLVSIKVKKSDYCQPCQIMDSRYANTSKNPKSFAATSLEGGNQTEHGNWVCTLDSSNSVRLVIFEKLLKCSCSVKFLKSLTEGIEEGTMTYSGFIVSDHWVSINDLIYGRRVSLFYPFLVKCIQLYNWREVQVSTIFPWWPNRRFSPLRFKYQWPHMAVWSSKKVAQVSTLWGQLGRGHNFP